MGNMMSAISLQQPVLSQFEKLRCGDPICSWIGKRGWLCFLFPHMNWAMSIAKGPNWPYICAILVVLWLGQDLQSTNYLNMRPLESPCSLLLVPHCLATRGLGLYRCFPISWNERNLLIAYPLLHVVLSVAKTTS